MELRTVDDGIELDRIIAEGAKRAVVVGAGYIGIEVAEALLARGLEVSVVELADAAMATTLDPDMASKVTDALRDAGAEVLLGAGVEGFESTDGRLAAVVAGGRSIPADVAVLGLGVRANSGLAAGAGIEVGSAGGIVVDERMHTSADGVWAAGDCVESRNRVTGESMVVALGTHANKQGRVLGTNLGGGSATFPGLIGTAVTKFRGLEIGRTGITESDAERLGWDVVASTAQSKTRAGYYPGAEPVTVKLITDRSDGRLLGAQVIGGVGAGKRIDPLAVAVWCEMGVEELSMADLSYAPPVSPVWDPVVFAAGVAARDLRS
jgi:NADPH-dependent 2,4-dienoyl-CoA reductase/sulfur reductase-like enzyme